MFKSDVMPKKCIVCGNSQNKPVFTEFGVDILRCPECGHVFSSYEADQHYDGYFGETVGPEAQFMLDEAHGAIYGDFCRKFIEGKSGRLLDVGCGLGYFVKKISSSPGWQAYGCEISKTAVEFAKDKLGLKNVFCGKIEESGFPEKFFDIITLWDVIEHIPKPDFVLSCLSKILKDDGLLFIHTPNVRVHLLKARLKKFLRGMKRELHYLEAKDHINHYSEKTLATVLRRNTFKNVRFLHMSPTQSMAGSRSSILCMAKNLFFYGTKILSAITMGRVNLDNLFAVATK
jgi:2-polyprenyl-3-methyl-5-hydroxy-6-metoxy-1,4-benzoquinol methylase